MELRQIEYFLAVLKHKSYTKAANALFISQPTLSVSIQKLENELGIKLLERDNKGITVTKEGEIFQKQAEKLLTDADALLALMRDINPSLKKCVSIAFPSTIGSWLWKELLSTFPRVHPDIELAIQDLGTIDIVNRLKAVELEVGYGVLDLARDDDIEFEKIKEGELKLILPAAHPLARRQRVRLSELTGELVLMYCKNTTFTEKLFLEELANAGISPNLFYVREQSSVFDIVAQGCGIAPVLNDAVSAIRDNPKIVSRGFKNPVRFNAGLIWNKNVFLSASAREFQNFIRGYKDTP